MSLVLQDKLVLSPETAEHLQEEIDLLQAASDCADVVGTHQELVDYDTSTLTDQAIVKVLQDETENNAQAYWRWDASTQTWSLVGSLGPYVNTVDTANKIYGTDENGEQTTYNINEYQEKTKITTVDSATPTIVLADNTIFNCTTSLTSLAFTLPTEDSVDFSCQVNFTSGSTATSAPTITSGTIKWIGDNVNEANGFVPRASCKYTIIFYYDGTNYRGVVQGISL